MNTLKKFDCLTAGLAIFAMFFGAGNIIFPLALGQVALAKTPWALSGFLLTAVLMPFIGLFAMFRYQGQVRAFFGRVGRVPGFALACLIIALIGPFGAAPRCIALAHSTMSTSMTDIPLIYFGLVACLLIFLFAYKDNRLLKLLGYVLAPLKIALLVWIIVKGYIGAPETAVTSISASEVSLFWHGLKEGYNTMDLLAAFFFSPMILLSMSSFAKDASFGRFLTYASSIGACLLAGVYIGFGMLAYLYAPQLEGFSNDQLLAAIAMKVLGPYAGIIVSITVAVACLTTAIALVAAFASFIHKEVLKQKVGYRPLLLMSVIITFALTTLEFQGIARLLNPVLAICYPGLIVLTFYNLFFPRRQMRLEEV